MRDDLFDLIWCGVVLLWNEVRGQITFCYYFSEFCIFIDVNIWPSGFGLLVLAFQPCLVIFGNNKNLERLRAGLKIQKVGEREREREREREKHPNKFKHNALCSEYKCLSCNLSTFALTKKVIQLALKRKLCEATWGVCYDKKRPFFYRNFSR